jgi:hypothetical protein
LHDLFPASHNGFVSRQFDGIVPQGSLVGTDQIDSLGCARLNGQDCKNSPADSRNFEFHNLHFS